MKKESLSIMTVKTLLAVIIFAGMGTIIIGGAYIIGEYSKNSNNQSINNNKIWNPTNECLSSNSKSCNRDCQVDSDCKYTCGCGAINKNEICDDEGIIYDCVGHYVGCKKGKCVLGEEKLLNQPDTSVWQTYRNEEFGFEFEYPEDYLLKEPSNSYIYLKSKNNKTIFERIINIEVEEKTLINGKFSLSDASKMSFEEFISKNIKLGCSASRGGEISIESYCTDEVEIKPFLNTKETMGYEIYITEITEISTAEKITTEKRKKGPIFAFNISEHNLNRGLLFQLSGEVEKSLEKEIYNETLKQILSTFKFIN